MGVLRISLVPRSTKKLRPQSENVGVPVGTPLCRFWTEGPIQDPIGYSLGPCWDQARPDINPTPTNPDPTPTKSNQTDPFRLGRPDQTQQPTRPDQTQTRNRLRPDPTQQHARTKQKKNKRKRKETWTKRKVNETWTTRNVNEQWTQRNVNETKQNKTKWNENENDN